MDLLIKPEVDKAAIRSLQDEILVNQRQMQYMVIDHLIEEKEMLSPEQGMKMMQYIREQYRRGSGKGSGLGIGQVLGEKSGTEPEQDSTKWRKRQF